MNASSIFQTVFRPFMVATTLFASVNCVADSTDYIDLRIKNNTPETIEIVEKKSSMVTNFPSQTTLLPGQESKATSVQFEDSVWKNGSASIMVNNTSECYLNFVPPGVYSQYPQLLVDSVVCSINGKNKKYQLTSTNQKVSDNQTISIITIQ